MLISGNRLNHIIRESIEKVLLSESFSSSMIRDFFMSHGGVDRGYRNFSAGDIRDDEITYFKEYPSFREARKFVGSVRRPNGFGKRSDMDVNNYFEIFVASDGSALVVGVDRNKVSIGITWGGERIKKVADRLNSNGWNFKTRDNRYVDDSDEYYYGGDVKRSPANDFGLYKSSDFRNKMKGVNDGRELMSPEDFASWRDSRASHLRDYMRRNYSNGGRVKYKK